MNQVVKLTSKSWKVCFRFAFVCLLVLLATQFSQAQTVGETGPPYSPAPKELMEKSSGQPMVPSKVEHFPMVQNKEVKEAGAAPQKMEKSQTETLKELAASNERILADPNASPATKQKAQRELRLQKLKLKNMAVE